MKFGDFPVDQAAGIILAHSQRVGDMLLKKGSVLTGAETDALIKAGVRSITGVRLDPEDFDENAAAEKIAQVAAGSHTTISVARTGRCNVLAAGRGLVTLDPSRIDALNLVDETVTLATLVPYAAVEKGDIVATAKIITFGVAKQTVERCEKIARDSVPLVSIAPFKAKKIGLVQTFFPTHREQIFDKATAVTRARVLSLGCEFVDDIRIPHTADDVAKGLRTLQESGCHIALALGASAIADRRDIIPAAVASCGGTIDHFGMPVDPGNLMMLGRIGDMHILGLPGSARSPRLHGFDWVLQRLVADIVVTGEDLMRMGVGGLLKEIPGRPMPRAKISVSDKPPRRAAGSHKVAAIVLAAGQSRRMGSVNKLLADIGGKPMTAHVVDAAVASGASPVIIVTGHEPGLLEEALADRDVRFIHNPDFADGLSTSLRAGLSLLDPEYDGAVVCLGDMPSVSANHINRLIDAFDPAAGHAIIVPTFKGKRGNPVLWHRRFFAAMSDVSGDVGARHLI
ncbi:MAG: molybdopterin-binding/glycosyltransferase family 2 protein, partial [Proteobacteria bacterium]|nr:molybdopterin-binding/glycosyltransferase family 2 protein [Pseudomonadota bacterium]